MEAANLWWERMFGPEHTLEKLIQSFQGDSRAVVFRIPSDVSFLPDLRELVKQGWRVRSRKSSLEVIEFDCADCAGDFDGALLEKLASQELPLRKEGEPLADFILRSKLLDGRALWIVGVDGQTCEKACRLAQAFRSGKAEGGFILLELRYGLRSAPLSPRDEITLSVDETDIETYATDLFRTRYAEERFKPCVYRYLSFLAASLCGTDAELAERFSLTFDYTRDDPAETIGRIMESGGFAENRGDGANEGQPQHIFRLLRSGDKKEIETRVWRAQIRAVFPILEDIRRILIDRYREFWLFCLSHFKDSEGRREPSPESLELANLNFYVHNAPDSSVVSPGDYANIGFLREQRNRLAHLESLNAASVARIFEMIGDYGLQ